MLCSDCRKNPASVVLQVLVNNQLGQYHLCGPCAARKEAALAAEPAALLSALLAELAAPPSRPARRRAWKCAGCGLDYQAFRKTGRLGCAHCYQSFAAALEPLLRKVHGAAAHTGKGAAP